MKAKSTIVARNALPSPTLLPGSPQDDGSGLPMAAHGGQIGAERLVIRWMSARVMPGRLAQSVTQLAATPGFRKPCRSSAGGSP